tara:strand:+ start:102 stop:326 length:225 start_codon:yes stop_codon:yes gene_type:complete
VVQGKAGFAPCVQGIDTDETVTPKYCCDRFLPVGSVPGFCLAVMVVCQERNIQIDHLNFDVTILFIKFYLKVFH